MRLENTRFIGWASSGRSCLPFDGLLAQYAVLRDATANLVHGEHNVPAELWPFITIASFSYAFNVYKAIGLILPELYHESGAVLLRQLWEVSLNLHWIERDPLDRAPAFCNYTIMELRKVMQKTGETAPLKNFDESTTRFQARFRYQDQRGRDRSHSNFAASTIEQRANELGDPWKSDYTLLYCLASMHAHGAPGAVMQQHFVHPSTSSQAKEKDSTALVAFLSMKVLVDDVQLLVRQRVLRESKPVDEVFSKVRALISEADES